MTVLKLARYADDGRLIDPGDADFIRERKLDAETVLDFSEVTEIAPAFLDNLLRNETPESIGDRIEGLTPVADAALSAWMDRSSTAVAPIEKPRPKPKVRTPAPRRTQYLHERPPVTDDRFTPTRLFHRLSEALRGYIESAYPLSDRIMVKARRHLLETEANGHLLAQEPFIEATTRYKTSKLGYPDLGLPAHISELLEHLADTPTQASTPDRPKKVLFTEIYEHQEEAFRAFMNEGKEVIVATGTGSGKTECFLVPMLGGMYDEAFRRPESFAQHAVRALILYPMNALVNDQLSRLRLLFGELEVAKAFKKVGCGRFPRFGMYTGRTPYPGKRNATRDGERVDPLLKYYKNMPKDLKTRLRQLGRYPAKDLEAFYAEREVRQEVYKTGRNAGKSYTRYNWERRLHTGADDRELITRHEMVHGVGTRPGHSPDILVTNYSMLEYMLMRPFERPIFEETRRWLGQEGNSLLLVLDEAHMYRGAKGAEVAFLLRRLRARLGIHNRPEKLRVIATSASLGTDEAARENVRKFLADLLGKRPEDFRTVVGTRDLPDPAAPASAAETELLAGIDLEGLNEAKGGKSLHDCLAPLFGFYGTTCSSETEIDVMTTLYDTLKDKHYVNLLVRAAAASAKSIGSLAAEIFPEGEGRQRALEALLSLVTLARKEPDNPGLVPTRVHGIFRGLQGLYACINPNCPGRQVVPGETAALGKLFARPQTACDACGARVFEIASCRSCGSPYILAYVETGTLDRTVFLWGETEGNLAKVELLPLRPRYTEHTEQVRVHLNTGYLDVESRYPDEEVRVLSLWINDRNQRQTAFDRCAMCQPTGRARSRIYDFRTRGEQPFTALIEAQFAEQPPQKMEPGLSNHGRKVLVFSDGRQKAARLAPALEHSHARDLFRQVLVLAAQQLKELNGFSEMHHLYPTVVWLCENEGYNLFPSKDEVEYSNHRRRTRGKSLEEALRMANRGSLKPTKSFAQALFSELTDRYYSIPALALGAVEESPHLETIFDDFPNVGLDGEAVKALFRAWLRLHLERRSFRPDGAETSDLGEGWASPVGVNAERMNQVLPHRFNEYVLRVLGDEEDAAERVSTWFQRLVRSSELLDLENDLYYLQSTGLCLNLKLESAWLRCVDCGRIHPEGLADICPACLGKLVEADDAYLDARTGFYRDQVLRAFDSNHLEPFGLVAAEHTAQLTGLPDEGAFNKVEEYELRFQDVALGDDPPIDVLSCTTTMEVGIDIGALAGVALRNVPPHVANYQQRAGRAGRRGRSIASVITFAHGTSHDAHYFEHPAAIISGIVRPPVVYVENQQVLERHVNAYLVQRFFHEQVPTDTGHSAYKLFEALGTVEQFLSEVHACSLIRFEAWLADNEIQLKQELRDWVPSYSYGLGQPIAGVDQTIEDAVSRLKNRLRVVLPVNEYPERENYEGLEREILDRRLGETLLETLIGHAVLPRYAFPLDVVQFWVPSRRKPGDPIGRKRFDYEPQRDLQLALTEYAPGRSLTIDKYRFTAEALFSPYEPKVEVTLSNRTPYTACKDCTFVSLDPGAQGLALCPCCGSDQLLHTFFIRPAGFAPDVNTKREIDKGQPIAFAGMTDRAKLEMQDPSGSWDNELYGGRLRIWNGSRMLASVNKGVGERGFRVCPDCGRAEPEYGPGFTATKLIHGGNPVSHQHPLENGVICTGVAEGPFYLGHRFPTDTLLLRIKVDDPLRLGSTMMPGLISRAARMALTTMVEAISLAASRQLQIEEGEMSGWWTPILGGPTGEAQIYLYDLLPGGAGYARAVGEAIVDVLDETESILSSCDCPFSCYRCLRHYGNNYIHASLDRHLALALLNHVRYGRTPNVPKERQRNDLFGLSEYLRLRGLANEIGKIENGVEVPMVVQRAGAPLWIDVHHPLVDPDRHPSEVSQAANAAFQELIQIDDHTLVHDLPAAVARLGIPDGAVS